MAVSDEVRQKCALSFVALCESHRNLDANAFTRHLHDLQETSFLETNANADYLEIQDEYSPAIAKILLEIISSQPEFLAELAKHMGPKFAPDVEAAHYLIESHLSEILESLRPALSSDPEHFKDLEDRFYEYYLYYVDDLIDWEKQVREKHGFSPFLDGKAINRIVNRFLSLPLYISEWVSKGQSNEMKRRDYLPNRIYTQEMFEHTYKLCQGIRKQYGAAEETLANFGFPYTKLDSYLKQYRKNYLNRKQKGTTLP